MTAGLQRMSLTFGEVASLEQHLADLGTSLSAEDANDFVKEVGDWIREHRSARSHSIDLQSLGLLCTYVRDQTEGRVRLVAMGALVLARKEVTNNPDRAQFVLRFALDRIRSLTGEAPIWNGIRLSPTEETEAAALFDAARGDRSYSDDLLVSRARSFIAEYEGEAFLFGRLAADLSFLLEAWHSSASSPAQQDVARAALTYFAVVGDAIPDDLGLVGLLDDAFVIQRAVHQLRPERAAVTTLLDELVSHWPFIHDMVLESANRRYVLSEFMLVNVALLLEKVWESGDTTGVALIVPETGPLAFVIGFVRAIAGARAHAADQGPPDFRPGERLSNRDTGAEIIFEGWIRLKGTESCPCAAAEATHFKFKTAGGGGKRPHVRPSAHSLHPIDHLTSFRRSPRSEGSLRRGQLTFRSEGIAVGPLEQLFGMAKPLVLPPQRSRVLVVETVGLSRTLARELTLFGTALEDVLPMGQARLDEEDFSETRWTRHGPGGKPMLTVVRHASEAAAFLDQNAGDVVGVVATVRSGSRDTTSLCQIASRGIPVLAVVEQSDVEAHGRLEAAGFRFWAWDENWLGTLYWPAYRIGGRHPLVNLEQRLSTSPRSKVHVVMIDVQGMEEAAEALRDLRRLARAEESEALESVVDRAVGLVLELCRIVTPLTQARVASVSARIGVLRESIRNESWWNERSSELAERTLSALERALASLSQGNPKFEQLQRWGKSHPRGVVAATTAMREELAPRDELKGIHVLANLRGRQRERHLLIPAWLQRDRMEKMLSPSSAEDVTLLLYPPERVWYDLYRARTTAANAKMRALVAARGPFRGLGRNRGGETGPPLRPPDLQDDTGPDEIQYRMRRRHAIEALGSAVGESAPARLVHFAGGAWAAFSLTRQVQTVTMATELGSDEADLELRPVPDLQSGDLVLLLRGSDHDALREAVDAEAPTGARETAAMWRDALVRYVRRGGTCDSLVSALAKAGCRRTTATVWRWLEDDSVIGPRHGAVDIEAIARATGDRPLATGIRSCVEAVTRLRGLHLSVAHRLARRALERAKEWLDAGASPSELVEVEDRVVLAAVDGVDPEIITVPRGALNRLQEA